MSEEEIFAQHRDARPDVLLLLADEACALWMTGTRKSSVAAIWESIRHEQLDASEVEPQLHRLYARAIVDMYPNLRRMFSFRRNPARGRLRVESVVEAPSTEHEGRLPASSRAR